ncbi:MAG: peptidoglycan-binding domain-containing protein [Flavonifractor plautii]
MLRTISFAYPFLPRLTPDGIFGERTLEAVMLFQREFFPPVTRTAINQATWDAIVFLVSPGGFPPHSAAHPQLSKSRVFRRTG